MAGNRGLSPADRGSPAPSPQRNGRHSAEEGVGEFPVFTPFVPLGDFVRELGPGPSKEAVHVYLERMAEKGWQIMNEARPAVCMCLSLCPRQFPSPRSADFPFSTLIAKRCAGLNRPTELCCVALRRRQFAVVLDAAAQGAFEDKGGGRVGSGSGGAKKREPKEPDETSVWFEDPSQARVPAQSGGDPSLTDATGADFTHAAATIARLVAGLLAYVRSACVVCCSQQQTFLGAVRLRRGGSCGPSTPHTRGGPRWWWIPSRTLSRCAAADTYPLRGSHPIGRAWWRI